jgi:hypothetical protein
MGTVGLLIYGYISGKYFVKRKKNAIPYIKIIIWSIINHEIK